jgi:hypothetical protein
VASSQPSPEALPFDRKHFHSFPPKQGVDLLAHVFIHLDERPPGAFESFAPNLLRRVDAEFAAAAIAPRDNQSETWQARPVLTPAIVSNQFSITFTPVQFYTYVPQRSTNLIQTSWTALASTNAPSSDANITMTAPLGPAANVFHRLRVMMP